MILGIDVGGTHTDSVLMDGRKIIRKSKVLTDKENILKSVLLATQSVAKEDDIKKLQRIVLSTTLTTNAVVQNQLDKVGLVVMNGPGVSPKDLPLHELSNYVTGYMSHRGIEAEAPDEEELSLLKSRFKKEKLNRFAIVGKFSTRNPAHEQFVNDCLSGIAKHASQSHQLSGSLNFPRRIATTYLNEAVWHLQQTLANQLKEYMKEIGADVPLYILKADGGTIEFEQSRETPVQTILSGPAATIMGVLPYIASDKDSISVDIGGTTTDIALFADGVPLLEPQGITIENHKTSVRGLLTHSIGVGGDSHVRVENGKLLLGPERKGAAMAFGGPVPTTTDALIVLGIADIGDKALAQKAITQLAKDYGKDEKTTAQAVLDLACSLIVEKINQMLNEINSKPVYTIHELLEGKKIEPKEVVVVGGPAPFMASRLCEMLNCPTSVPNDSDVINASGAATARTTVELNIVADTEAQVMSIAEEGIQQSIDRRMSVKDVIALGTEKLIARAKQAGAKDEDIEVEVADEQVFNVVRGYSTMGKNMRIRLQVKPGLIKGTTN